MIVDLAFKFHGEVRRSRKRTTEDVFFVDSVPFEVREVSASDAPPAVWWKTPSDHDSVRTCMRGFEGHLYAPVSPSAMKGLEGVADDSGIAWRKAGRIHRDDRPLFVDAEGLRAMAASGRVSQVTRLGREPELIPFGDMTGIAEVRSHDREERLVEARREFSDLLLVDGLLHVRRPCPVIVVRKHVGSGLSFEYSDRVDGNNLPLTFAIDRFADARAAFVAKVMQSYQKPSEFDKFRPEIERPDLLGFDEQDFLIRQTSRHVLKVLSRNNSGRGRLPDISTLGRDCIMAFGQLRDQEASGVAWPALVPHLRRLGELLRSESAMYWHLPELMDAVLARMEAEGHLAQPAPQDLEAMDMVFP